MGLVGLGRKCDSLAGNEDLPDEGGGVVVGEAGEGPAGLGEDEVGAFAAGHGAGLSAEPEGGGTVQSDRGQRLVRCKLHLDTSHGHH